MKGTSQKNFYELLGVAQEAAPDEIRKAYLKLAHKYHPDKTGGDEKAETLLKEINAAYDTLKNPEKRKQYDAVLSGAAFGGGMGGGPAGAGGFDFSGFGGSGGAAGFNFEDLFGSVFGGGRGPTGTQARGGAAEGADLETTVRISLNEAAGGTKKTLRLRKNETCTVCSGSGAAEGSQPQPCPDCGGSGQLLQNNGAFSIRKTCPRCRGEGQVIANPCKNCNGAGIKPVEKTLSVDIPSGVDTGARLRVAGQGEAGRRGGPSGDLFVVIDVQGDTFFERKGDDLHCEVPITLTQAALGDTVRVPTMSGIAELTIPEGTQTGARFRMRGQGMPRLNGRGHGDQFVRVQVEVPVKLNKRQRELLRELAEHTEEASLPKRRGFLDWLKKNRGA